MGTSVEAFGKDAQTTTEQTVDVDEPLEASTECVAAPDFSSSQCTLPTESQD